MIQIKRIHILNLGFNSEWIIESFKKSRPDKVYLIRKKDEPEEAQKTEKEIKRFVQRTGGEFESKIYEGDLYELIKKLRGIIQSEKDNLIYLGISSGSRDNLAAFMISSMIFYEEVQGIFLYSLKNGQFLELPHLEVKLPKKEVIKAIKYIREKGKCRKKELRDFLFDNEIISVNEKSKFKDHAKYVKMNRSILDYALEWNLIKIKGKRKGSQISLTKEGEKWAKIF